MNINNLALRPLTAALQKKAIVELNEVPDKIADDIATLRKWILQQPHLKARTSDQFLVAFLRGCKYSLEKAKRKIDNYYTIRCCNPDIFRGFIDENRIRAIIRLGTGLTLPNTLESDGSVLSFIRPGHYSVEQYNIFELLHTSFLAQDVQMIYDDRAVINGFTILIDVGEYTIAHFLQINMAKMKCLLRYAEEALPMRIKAFHLFNSSSSFEKIFAILKPVLPAKMQKRVYVHSKMEGLYQHIPQKYLPKEYGGENDVVDDIITRAESVFFKHRDYLLEEQQYGIDEKLRIDKISQFENIYEMEGSFRKLNFD